MTTPLAVVDERTGRVLRGGLVLTPDGVKRFSKGQNIYRPARPSSRQIYNALAADARAHGERPISYRAWLKVAALQRRMAATDRGGDIRL